MVGNVVVREVLVDYVVDREMEADYEEERDEEVGWSEDDLEDLIFFKYVITRDHIYHWFYPMYDIKIIIIRKPKIKLLISKITNYFN